MDIITSYPTSKSGIIVELKTPVYVHVFFDKLSNKLLWLFCLCVFSPNEIAYFSSILRIKTIFFGRHSILREKKSPLAFNFELRRTLTIHGEYGTSIMAYIPLWLISNQNSRIALCSYSVFNNNNDTITFL